MLRMPSFFMRGLVWVRGGRFMIILMIRLCIRMSGWIYVLVGFLVPHIVMFLIRCG